MKDCWCSRKLEELKEKPKSEWTIDDYEAWNYCLNTMSEEMDDDEWNEWNSYC